MTAALVTALVVVLVVVGWLLITANRLDRLHIRTDAAWAALDAALERRAVLARVLAETDPDLRRAADLTRRAGRADREAAENALTAALAAADRADRSPALLAELDDACHRVRLARHVYNEAVRDTLRLRAPRRVRWLRLAGTAPRPVYFDITDPP